MKMKNVISVPFWSDSPPIHRLLVGLSILLILIGSENSRAATVVTRVDSSSEVADSVMLDLGEGPVSSGPISVSLVPGDRSSVTFDIDGRNGSLDVMLAFSASDIGVSTQMRIKAIGPVTWGLDILSGELGAWGIAGGGGVIGEGVPLPRTVLAKVIGFDVTGFPKGDPDQDPPPLPPIASTYPDPFDPFPPEVVPARLDLPGGFDPISDAELLALLSPGQTFEAPFAYNSIVRIPGQSGDIPITGTGAMSLTIIPEPLCLTYLLFCLGGLTLKRYRSKAVSV